MYWGAALKYFEGILAYHYAHCNTCRPCVDSPVDLRVADSDVAIEGHGAHVEEGADAGGQTQWRRHLTQDWMIVEILLSFEGACSETCEWKYSTWKSRQNKKVFLRGHKRYTVRRVASTTPSLAGEVPCPRYPWEGTWDQSLGYPQKRHGTSGSIMGLR